MTKTVVAVTSVNPNAMEALETYVEVVGRLMQNVGARVLARYELTSSLTGSDCPQFVSVVEYPSSEAIDEVFNHRDYIALETARKLAFSKYEVYLAD